MKGRPRRGFATPHMATLLPKEALEQSEDVKGYERQESVPFSVNYVSTTLQFYDIHDRLDFQQPGHVFEWLMQKAKYAIDKLPPSSIQNSNDIPGELPPKRGDDDHMIELIPGSSPPNKPPYRVSQAQQEEIMRQVNELVEKGMVRPSSSPFCSPILLVQKKDGTYHMWVDYRALNRITIKNRFPVPRVEDLFDKLQGSTYFSRIDLKSGYHQIRIVNEDIVKTAFRTMFGLYEYIVMPFGLTNAPATFNRMMERIFRPHRNFTGVFFDDVIIYSKTIDKREVMS
ncbi:hypothetical protein L7F22_036877 [Adiantum nelumboides]|nr:hypothetical protein [Adiantum nelumboides]